MKNYVVAQLGISADGKWTVTYHGNVPEQGGLERKTGQLTFLSVDDAITFMQREIPQHTDYYLDLIKKGFDKKVD